MERLARCPRLSAAMGSRIRSSWPLVIVLALTAAGAVATVLPDSSQKIPGNQGDSVWRRTKDGWEIAWWLQPTKTFHKPHLHPLVVAACQLTIVSLLRLLGWGNSQRHGSPFRKEKALESGDGPGRLQKRDRSADSREDVAAIHELPLPR